MFAAVFYWTIFIIWYLATSYGQMKLFEKAEQPGWAAFVPFYSSFITLKLIGKPLWWVALLAIPVINILVWVAMVIEFVKSYGKYKLGEHAISLLAPFVYFPLIGHDQKVDYLGPPDQHKNVPAKSSLREWGDAILFAGVAALIIRTFFIEAFMIPTSSMERTLMAGDFLFVSKFKYGSRMPMTPLSIPFIHNKIGSGKGAVPSYLSWLQLPYYRLPGSTIQRNDIVVFNYPEHDIHDLGDGAGLVEPISMKENYIKRCVAIPGDTLQVINQQVYNNSDENWNPAHLQLEYIAITNGSQFSFRRDLQPLGYRRFNEMRPEQNINANYFRGRDNAYHFFADAETKEKLLGLNQVIKLDTVGEEAGVAAPRIYPKIKNRGGKLFKFNADNFGPIVIPKRGMKIELTQENLSTYWRCIDIYEGHELKEANGKIYIDDKEVTEYTFEMDYYFMMGDNRHNSEDSRYWGFVPESHIVGTPLFVFFSYEKQDGKNFFQSIRWSRIGRGFLD